MGRIRFALDPGVNPGSRFFILLWLNDGTQRISGGHINPPRKLLTLRMICL
ncbi:hypothetical protein QUF80_21275 [Desulfococcaceae bacterium HSG8]|nr:hypothetical protein [Desulfococcaceae bacterium HSG8]